MFERFQKVAPGASNLFPFLEPFQAQSDAMEQMLG
jgi:hypothetical protein